MALPQYSGTLGIRNAAHLLRRTTFGPNKAAIDSFASKTAIDAINSLTTTVATPAPPLDLATGLSWLPVPDPNSNSDSGTLSGYFKSWWLDQMLNSGNNIKEKMVFLFHTFFPTIDSAVENATSLYNQNALFRYHALGNIKTLTKKICVDNAMLVVLDGRLNEAGLPNENFARELFELHTIGRGPEITVGDYTNYTEADIKVAARVLSGWTNDPDFGTNITDSQHPDYSSNIDPDSGIPLGILKGDGIYATRHDADNAISTDPTKDTERKFSAAFQNRTLNELSVVNGQATKASAKDQVSQLIDMIFDQRATAVNFCSKIYRYFVYWDTTTTEATDVISSLADTFIANSFEILPVIKELLTSQYFFDAQNADTTDNTHGDIIKSPIEVSLGALRFFNVAVPTATSSLANYYDFYGGILSSLSDQGIQLYEPYDVAGYDAYFQQPDYNRNWITVNTLAYRYDFTLKLANNTFSTMISIDFSSYIKTNISDPTSPTVILQHFVDYLLPEIISTTGTDNRFDYFLNILRDGTDDVIWTDEWTYATNSADYSKVNDQLSKFIAALLQTPEYQLM